MRVLVLIDFHNHAAPLPIDDKIHPSQGLVGLTAEPHSNFAVKGDTRAREELGNLLLSFLLALMASLCVDAAFVAGEVTTVRKSSPAALEHTDKRLLARVGAFVVNNSPTFANAAPQPSKSHVKGLSLVWARLWEVRLLACAQVNLQPSKSHM